MRWGCSRRITPYTLLSRIPSSRANCSFKTHAATCRISDPLACRRLSPARKIRLHIKLYRPGDWSAVRCNAQYIGGWRARKYMRQDASICDLACRPGFHKLLTQPAYGKLEPRLVSMLCRCRRRGWGHKRSPNPGRRLLVSRVAPTRSVQCPLLAKSNVDAGLGFIDSELVSMRQVLRERVGWRSLPWRTCGLNSGGVADMRSTPVYGAAFAATALLKAAA